MVHQEDDALDGWGVGESGDGGVKLFTADGDEEDVCVEVWRQGLEDTERRGVDPHCLEILDGGAVLAKLGRTVRMCDQGDLVACCGESDGVDRSLHACAEDDDVHGSSLRILRTAVVAARLRTRRDAG